MHERHRLSPTDFAQVLQPCALPMAERGRRSRIPRTAHRILGLRRGELDPVQIILAAQIRLRRWRRLVPGDPRHAEGTACGVPPAGQVQRIIRARDNLLSIANRQAMDPADEQLR